MELRVEGPSPFRVIKCNLLHILGNVDVSVRRLEACSSAGGKGLQQTSKRCR
jgi:hypothetical protein